MSGVNRVLINRLESDSRKNASYTTIRKLADALNVTAESLLEGVEVSVPPKPLSFIFREFQQKYDGMTLIEIPLRGAVPAGIPCSVSEEKGEYISVPREDLGGASPLTLYALKVSGDSLQGDGIYSGDTMVVDSASTEISDGKIYILRLGNECVARHVFRMDDHLRLVSSNGEYREILATDAEILGRVILTGRWKRF